MNKYAAGGKCGSMSGGGKSPFCDFVTGSQVKEVNSNLSALMAERNKLDSLFSGQHQLPNCDAVTSVASHASTAPPAEQRQHQPSTKKQESSAIVLSKISNGTKETRDSDIDFILSGDF